MSGMCMLTPRILFLLVFGAAPEVKRKNGSPTWGSDSSTSVKLNVGPVRIPQGDPTAVIMVYGWV